MNTYSVLIKRSSFKIELSANFNMNVTRFINIIAATGTRPTMITIPMQTVEAPVPFGVRLGFTITFTTVFGLLFFFIMVQLWLILYYRHKKLSYQSIFLFICLLWAAVRTTLFSFYFHDSRKANSLSSFPRWLMYAFPSCLQFLTLTLLTLYLVQVVLHSGRTSLTEPKRYNKYVYGTFATINFIFFVMNTMSSFLCRCQDVHYKIVVARVVVNDMLFVLSGFALSICIHKITRIPTATLLLELGQETTACQATVICVLLVTLYFSRAVYNIVAVTVPHNISNFGYGWINISDEGEIKNKAMLKSEVVNESYISFGIVLLLWELLPTFMIVWFFRVKRPQTTAATGPSAIASSSVDKKSFFDNPRRYDSDEDLHSVNCPGRGSSYDIPGILSPASSYCFSTNQGTQSNRSYGSIPVMRQNNSLNRSNSYPNACIPGTTPPLLFSSGHHGYSKGTLPTLVDQGH